MPSLQNTAPGAKKMIFANALDPFAPFLGSEQNDETATEHLSLSEQLDTRLRLNESATNQHLTSDVSQQNRHYVQKQQQPQPQHIPSQLPPTNTSNELNTTLDDNQKDVENDCDSDDDDELEFGDGDAALEAFRQRRLVELKRVHQQTVEQKAKGHGSVRVISQDEFLQECTSSKYVAAHFFHKDFERCKIMSHHLELIAPQHLSCKFVEIDAEKAPFFVVKLKVQVLPTLIVFRDGKAIQRLVGFEDLQEVSSISKTSNPDEFHTSRLGYWLEQTGAIEYEGLDNEDYHDQKGSRSSRTSNSLTTSRNSRYVECDDDP